MSFMDSPRREPVPPFGAWRYEDPRSPVVDYTGAFNRARASRLGSIPLEHDDEDEFYSQSSDDSQSAPSDAQENRVIRRHSRKKPFFKFLVCGGRDQVVDQVVA